MPITENQTSTDSSPPEVKNTDPVFIPPADSIPDDNFDKEEPRVFTDCNGKQWDFRITMAGARRVDNSVFSAIHDREFSLIEPDEIFWKKEMMKGSLVFAMIWAIVQPQTDGMSEADFLELFDGKAKWEAQLIFWGAIADFFPEQKTGLSILRDQLGKLHQKVGRALTGMGPLLEKKLDKLLAKEVAIIKKELSQEPGEESGSS